MWLDALLLVAALGSYGWYLKGGPLPPHVLAGRRFARLAARSALLFGGVALLVLAASGQLGALRSVPTEFAGPAAVARRWLPGMADPLAPALIAGGLLIGGGVGAAVSRWRRRPVFTFGDISAVLPRDRHELGGAALASINAGWAEELFFRLALPLLIARLTGSGWAGFAVATALFAAAHRYQGWQGIAATGAVGVLMATVYLASGQLWMAVALHALVNLNGLVLRPWIAGLGGVTRRDRAAHDDDR